MNVGTAIKHLRKANTLTLIDLANLAGTDAGNISRLENNKQNYSQGMIENIANALDIKLSELFRYAEELDSPTQTNENSILIREINQILNRFNTKAELTKVMSVVDALAPDEKAQKNAQVKSLRKL